MIEAVEKTESAHSITLERGKIRRKLINRMKKGEVLLVSDFEPLLDLGATVERLPQFTSSTVITKYGNETLLFDKSAEHWDFESTIARIDANNESFMGRVKRFLIEEKPYRGRRYHGPR